MGRTRTRSAERAYRNAYALGVYALAVVALAGSVGWGAARYVDGPPPAHTGGFGEPTCHRCHFGSEPNEPPGALTLRGVPERCSGGTHRLTLQLRRPDLRRAGFQVAARFADGPRAAQQAGTFQALDDRVLIVRVDSSGIEYAQHTRAGTRPTAADAASWEIEWTAPDSSAAVVFHAAVNAANDDDSEFGDRIYTASARACGGLKVKG